MAREAKEEAVISLRETDLYIVHVMHRYLPNDEWIDLFFATKKAERKTDEFGAA